MANGFLNLRRFVIGLLKYLWSAWPGSKNFHASESVIALQRSSAGGMPEGTGRYSMSVGFRHFVTMRKASLISLSSRCVCALRLHTGAQYLAVE